MSQMSMTASGMGLPSGASKRPERYIRVEEWGAVRWPRAMADDQGTKGQIFSVTTIATRDYE